MVQFSSDELYDFLIQEAESHFSECDRISAKGDPLANPGFQC